MVTASTDSLSTRRGRQRARARRRALGVAISVAIHGSVFGYLALSAGETLETPLAPQPIIVTLDLTPQLRLEPPPQLAPPLPEPPPPPEPTPQPQPAPQPTVVPAPVPVPMPPRVETPRPALAPAPQPQPAPQILNPAPSVRLQEQPAVRLQAAPALEDARSRAEAERRRREAEAALRGLTMPAPSPVPARPGSPSPLPPLPGSRATAAPGAPAAGRAGDPNRWRAGTFDGSGEGFRNALRRTVGCPDANAIGLTLAERDACRERNTRLAAANEQPVGPVSSARYIQRGLQDRDCRRMRRSDDHASTFGNGSEEATRGGVAGVPGCGLVLRNLDRIADALRGRDHVD